MPPEVFGVITFAPKLVINVTPILYCHQQGLTFAPTSSRNQAPHPDEDLTAAVLTVGALLPIVDPAVP
jgi:hypothetical protein